MKKTNFLFSIILVMITGIFMFSCQTESLDSGTETLNVVEGKSKKITKVKSNNDEDEDNGSCETAFAKGADDISTCFLDIDGIKSNRWGWTIGPLSEGNYTFEIYAGAGQCDITKGDAVGELTVEYTGGVATISFNMNSGSVLEETHLYLGNDPIPSKNGSLTVAPGQLPLSHDLDGASSDSYTINNLDGDIYVIAHSVVCNGDTDEECIPKPIQYCDGVRYNFWGLGTFWGGNYTSNDHQLVYTEYPDGTVNITGETRMNASRGCVATVDVWLIDPMNYELWTAGGGMALIPDGTCATVSPEELMYYIIDESRSSLVVSDCADSTDELQGNYYVLHSPQDYSKGFQIGNGGSLFNYGSDPGLSGWMFLQKEGSDKLAPADFNFLICE